MSPPRSTLLLVANWDSDVGYAWWLMESYWAVLAEHYHTHNSVLLAYPSISKLPSAIAQAPLEAIEQDFAATDMKSVWHQCRFLHRHTVRAIYFSDRATWHWRYLAYRLCGVRLIIVHDHTPGLRTQPVGMKRWLKAVVQRLPWITADGLIGATAFVRNRFIKVSQAPASRCFSVANGLPELAPVPERESVHTILGLPRERQILVMTGRASRYKGVEFVLSILARLIEQGISAVHFLFCGDGPDLEYFKRYALQLGIGGHVTFAGYRSDVDVLLPTCQIAIHPSSGEAGYSLSILEYMQAGLPVLVPDNPSVCGATRHGVTGLVYPEGDIDMACAALMRLLEDPELCKQMGHQASMDVQQHYNLRSTHGSLLDAFYQIDRHHALLSETGPRP